jgi:hypothetical protein
MAIVIKKEGWAVFTAEVNSYSSEVTDVFASAIPSDISAYDFAKALGLDPEKEKPLF